MAKSNFTIGLPYLFPGKESGQGVFEETFASELKKRGAKIKVFYPTNKELRKIEKIGSVLTMASMREHINEANKCDLLYSTNGLSIGFLDREVKAPMVAVFHSTTRTLFELFVEGNHKMAEYSLYQKYFNELEKISLVPEDIRQGSLETWALIEDFTIKNANYLVGVSKNVKKELKNFLSPKTKKVEVVSNGIEKSWFLEEKYLDCKRCQKISNNWSKKPIVMWIGRMGREHNSFKTKGIDRVLELFDRLNGKKVHKIVIAIVPKERVGYVDRYAKIFTKRGIDFYPNWPYNHLSHLMNKGDIFIMTSRYEGFSLSLVEAMASKMVPVAYSVGVVPEALKNGYNGYIVKNIDQMEEKVKWLLDHPKRREQMAEKAFETAKEKYQIDTMLDNYFSLFEKIIKRRNKLTF